MFKAVLIALYIWLFGVAPAHAEPVSAAIAAFSAFLGSGGIIAGIVKIALVAAANYGMSLIQQAKAKRQQRKDQNRPSGVTVSVQMGDTQPRSYLIGTRATAGRRVYAGSWGAVENTPNAYLTDVIELSCLPNHAGPQGIGAAWISDKKVTILWEQPHPDGRGYPVSEYRVSGTDYLWLKFLDGSQTEADEFLVNTFGAHATRPFKTTMIGRGCQVVILTARIHQNLFKGGAPQGLYQPKPMRLYDLRKDSTNGGDGTHRWADPSTWEASDNLPLMIYNIARGVYYDGRWLHGGRNFAQHRLPASSWIAGLNEGDRLLEGRKQFRGGLEVYVDQDPLEVIEELRLGCAAKLAEVGGILKILVGAPAAAVYSFTDAQIVITSDQDLEPFPTMSATHNTITATYPEPLQRWATKDAPERSSAALLARDGGERLPVAFTFEAVSDVDQVQSLMATMIEEEQRWRIHELVLPPDAAALEPNDVVSWSSARNEYSNKKFVIARALHLAGLCQQVQLKEMDPSDYDPPEILLPPVVGPIGPIDPPPQPLYGWTAVPAVLEGDGGVPFRPAIRIGVAPDQDDVRSVHVRVRLRSDASIQFDSAATLYGPPYSWILNGNFKSDTEYEVQGRFIPFSTRQTEPSEWLTVRTPFVPDDFTAELGNIGEDVKAVLNDLYAGLNRAESLIARLQQNLQITGGVSQTLGRKLQQLGASFTEEVVIITSNIANVVEKTEELIADFGENLANGMVAFQAVAAPEGVTVRYAVLLKASIGDEFKQSGLFIEIYTEGGVLKSRTVFDVDQFVVLGGGGAASYPMVFENGELKLNIANIGLVKAGTLNFGNGRVVINENGIVVSS